MKKKINFIRLFQIWGIIFLMGLGASFVTIDVINAYRDFNFRADQIRSDYINRHKQIIKQEVVRVVDMIRYEKAQSEVLTRRKIKSRVYEAYAIAQNLYQQNLSAESKDKIQRMILNALRPVRFENGNGYYFATRFDGVEVLFADRPQMEGLNLLNMQDTRGRYVVKDMIQIAKQSGEGFYEYHWTKPESAGNDFKKISFIKRFEPWDWFIGTGLYVDDIESQIKSDLLAAISRIRFGKEGYVFVNKFNGDALVSNGRLFSGTKKLWEVFSDNPEKMKGIFEKEYNAALKSEGDYIYYSHIKLTNPKEESPKVSFIYGVTDFQWIVGAGVYLDDVETDIALMQAELNNQIKAKMLYFVLIVIVIVGLFFLFFSWLNLRLKSDINFFVSFFKRAAHSDEEIDREHIKFIELDKMAGYANKMLTDRKQAQEALRESEEKFRTLVEQSPMGISLIGKDGRYKYINPRFRHMFGYTLEDIPTGTQWFEKVFPDKKDRDIVVKTWIEDRKKAGIGQSRPRIYTVTCKDGSRKEIHFRPVTMENLDQFVIYEDISERKNLEGQLRQSQKMEAIGTLAGGIAHDFNNILAAIIGYTELAQMKIDVDSEIQNELKEVLAASTRAKSLVKQILTFSRQPEEEQKPVQMSLVVKEALKLLRSSLPVTIDIRKNIQSQSVIMSDPTQLHQIVMNLCTNAAHALRIKGGILEITLTDVELDADFCSSHPQIQPGVYQKLTVSDTGHGITHDVMTRIFDPFFTTKEKGEGTGLGLSVVHGIVRNCGGTITVHSEPDKGTTFNLYFPIIESTVEEKSREYAAVPTGTEHILFVDDEKSIIDITKKILETLGYTVEIRTGSLESLELFKAMPDKFDLVVTDMTMPQMTGDMLARELMKIRPDIPVILCTGFSEKITKEKAEALGIKALLMKPLLKEEMAHTIRRVLDEVKGFDQP